MSRPTELYHVCFAVPSLEDAMHELTAMIGVSWGEPVRDRLGAWPYALVFSAEAPHLELVASTPDSPWGCAAPTFHHLGFWTHCLDDTVDSWLGDGGAMFHDGRQHGRRFAYVDAPRSGVRLEAVDDAQREGFLRRWAGPVS